MIKMNKVAVDMTAESGGEYMIRRISDDESFDLEGIED